jgi:hypothetical protein
MNFLYPDDYEDERRSKRDYEADYEDDNEEPNEKYKNLSNLEIGIISVLSILFLCFVGMELLR